ncbi:urease subunit beta [bacterium]|nr:MAG: urease subunit beta [bacterium]
MIPGEYRLLPDAIEINEGRRRVTIDVTNTGDRPIQVGSHYGFFEVNRALQFDREQAFGMRLDIPAGTAVRFEPGEQKPVTLVQIGGSHETFGLNSLSQGAKTFDESVSARLSEWEQL